MVDYAPEDTAKKESAERKNQSSTEQVDVISYAASKKKPSKVKGVLLMVMILVALAAAFFFFSTHEDDAATQALQKLSTAKTTTTLSPSTTLLNNSAPPTRLVWKNVTKSVAYNETFNFTAYIANPTLFAGENHSLIGFPARLKEDTIWRYYIVDDFNQSIEVQRNYWKSADSDTWESGDNVFKEFFPSEGVGTKLYNLTGEIDTFGGKPLLIVINMSPALRDAGFRNETTQVPIASE